MDDKHFKSFIHKGRRPDNNPPVSRKRNTNNKSDKLENSKKRN